MESLTKTKKLILAHFRFVIITALLSCSPPVETNFNLDTQIWINGSANCKTNNDVPIQIQQYDENTWILRQNKCINYEAPFMFLFFGNEKALLMDTGATNDEQSFPLYKTVQNIINNWQRLHHKQIQLIVAHTHAHGDHIAGDGQFRGKPNTTVVGIGETEIIEFFKFRNWPNDIVDFELGDRSLKIIAIPGHDSVSIAVYDPSTEILLTGDTFYPGRLYVRDWHSFKKSIDRLVRFTNSNQIKYLLGNHIEMTTTPGVDYPVGTAYQPDEQKLQLQLEELLKLQAALGMVGDTPSRKVLDKFIIYPK